MIYGKVKCSEGVTIGKVSIISILLTKISILRYPTQPIFWRFLKLTPIKDYPFYHNYKYLVSHPENVVLSIVPFDKETFEIPKMDLKCEINNIMNNTKGE